MYQKWHCDMKMQAVESDKNYYYKNSTDTLPDLNIVTISTLSKKLKTLLNILFHLVSQNK